MMMDFVLKTMNFQDRAGSVVLVGVQYGAVVARQFALLHPHEVSGLLLLEANGAAALGDDSAEATGWGAMVERGGIGYPFFH